MSTRIALLTFGSRGDVQPFVALARALQAKGAVPVVGAHPPFRGMVEGAGVAFAPLAGDPRAWMISQSRLARLAGRPAFLTALRRFRSEQQPLLRAMLDDSLALARSADAVAFSHGALAGPHLVAGLGLRGAYTALQPWEHSTAHPSVIFTQRRRGPRSLWRLWSRLSHPLGEHLVWQPWREVVNQWRRESLGLPPLPVWRSPWSLLGDGVPRLYGYSSVVAPAPEDWGDNRHLTGWWQLQEGADAVSDPALQRFLDEGDPPLYIGMGSYVPDDGGARLRATVLGALELLGLRAVLADGWAGLSSRNLPPTVFPIGYVQHSWLFPRVAAVVHHGGAGTAGTAFHAGRPQVVLPSFFDQFFWGERVRQLGVGPAPLPSQQVTAEDLATAIGEALLPEVAHRATALGRRLAGERGADRAAELLLGAFGAA